ncbi:alpha/beta hydrolase [Nocardia sp. NPDC024068]|uniref:alpha/beta fold hydrolase n=1 Tax=Nocardia sp. NPDC024068 TaxID=3157197 RepID=UPI0033E5633C
MVPVGDTALAVTDTGGPGIPVLYVNGHVATQHRWRRVIAELGPGWRHSTYDMRARGKLKASANYSFATNVADIDAVLAARGVSRALVIDWSYGAFVAARWTSRNPDRAIGAVLVDGAKPQQHPAQGLSYHCRGSSRGRRARPHAALRWHPGGGRGATPVGRPSETCGCPPDSDHRPWGRSRRRLPSHHVGSGKKIGLMRYLCRPPSGEFEAIDSRIFSS